MRMVHERTMEFQTLELRVYNKTNAEQILARIKLDYEQMLIIFYK